MNRISFRFASRISARLLTLAMVAAGAAAADAAIPHSDKLPGDASAAMGVPDAGAFWKKLHAVPTAQAIDQYINSPQVQQNLDYQQFQLDRSKLEQKLGFPLTPDSLFGPIFGDATLYIRAQGLGIPSYALMLGVKDGDKAQKLVTQIDAMLKDAADKTAATSATATATLTIGTSATATASTDALTFDRKPVSGVLFSHFVSHEGSAGTPVEGYYAIADKTLIYASTAAEATQYLGKGAPAAPSADLKPLTALLPWDKADAEGWVDGDAIMKKLGGGSLFGAGMGNLQSNSRMAFATTIEPNAIQSKYAVSPAPSKTPNVTAGKLEGLDFMGQAPIYSAITRSYDAQGVYDELSALASDPTIGALTGRMGGPSPLATAEQTLGLSFKDDVIPALANESFVSLEGINLNLTIPFLSSADIVAGSKLRDPAKMKAAMLKIEKAVASKVPSAVPADPADKSAPTSGFTSVQHGGVEVRGMSILPSISPTYAIAGNYLLIGLNQSAVFNALDAKGGALPSASKSPIYSAMAKLAGEQPLYDYSALDFARLQQTVVQPIVTQLSNPQTGESPIPSIVSKLLATLNWTAAITDEQNGLLVGFLTVQMR